jgi:DNA-binding ferritin-like protein (Dps family)
MAWGDDLLTRAARAVDWKKAFDDEMEQHPEDFRNHFLAEILSRVETAAHVSTKGGGIFEDLFKAGLNAATESQEIDDVLSELLADDFDGLVIDSPEWIEAKKRLVFAQDELRIFPFLTYPEGLEDLEEEEDEDEEEDAGKPDYCTNDQAETCAECSFTNYGRDCMNNPIQGGGSRNG